MFIIQLLLHVIRCLALCMLLIPGVELWQYRNVVMMDALLMQCISGGVTEFVGALYVCQIVAVMWWPEETPGCVSF